MNADKKENGSKPVEEGSVEIAVSSMAAQYFNLLRVTHTGEEFLFDLIQLKPGSGSLSSAHVGRYVTSVAHAKRIYEALGENIRKYEDKFGSIVQPKMKDDGNPNNM